MTSAASERIWHDNPRLMYILTGLTLFGSLVPVRVTLLIAVFGPIACAGAILACIRKLVGPALRQCKAAGYESVAWQSAKRTCFVFLLLAVMMLSMAALELTHLTSEPSARAGLQWLAVGIGCASASIFRAEWMVTRPPRL